MAAFPALRTGAVAQYPSSKDILFGTKVLRFVDGREQRYRTSAAPVRRWEIRLDAVDAVELAAIAAFFEAHQGRYGSFSFTDPWDGIEYADCSFDNDVFQARHVSDSRSSTRVLIRANSV